MFGHSHLKRARLILFTGIWFGLAALTISANGLVAKARAQGNDRRVLVGALAGVENLPINVRAFKFLQTDTWAKDLEIYIENKSERPVYFLGLSFGFPEIEMVVNTGTGIQKGIYGFSVSIGDPRLRYQGESAKDSDELVIAPGKEIVVKLPEQESKTFLAYLTGIGWEQQAIKKIRLDVTYINFGDGTGVELLDPKWKKHSTRPSQF